MSATAYISSGVLERHIMGLTTPEEIKELKEMTSQHPEIREEIKAIQKALLGYVLAHQVSPPEGLREKIMSDSKPQQAAESVSSRKTEPERKASTSRAEKSSGSNHFAGIAAGILALALVGVAFTAWTFFNDAEKLKVEVAEARTEVEQLQTAAAEQKEIQIKLQEEVAFLRDHNLTPIRLQGTVQAPDANAVIFWDNAKKASYIDVRKLPDVPDNQALHLWVTANGQTEHLGVVKSNPATQWNDLKFIENPYIYFVTLENEGVTLERPTRYRIVMTGRLKY